MALNRPAKVALNSSEKVLDRVLCVAGAMLFLQAPEFMQQYLQRLGGHLAEAQRRLGEYQAVARDTSQTLDHLIATSKANTDAAIARLGGVMEGAVHRVADLSAAEVAIREASPFTRPFVFLRHADPAIVHDTWTIYQPALPTTVEGLIYAGAGVVVMLAFYYGLIRYPTVRMYHRRQARKLARAPAARTPKPPVASGTPTAT
jgi:hypothetical protein